MIVSCWESVCLTRVSRDPRRKNMAGSCGYLEGCGYGAGVWLFHRGGSPLPQGKSSVLDCLAGVLFSLFVQLRLFDPYDDKDTKQVFELNKQEYIDLDIK